MARGKYKQKRRNKLSREISICSLGLPCRTTMLLEAAGIKTLYDLTMVVQQYDIARLPKLDAADIGAIRFALAAFEYKEKT